MPDRRRRNRTDRNSASFAAAPIDITKPEDRRWAASVLQASRAKSKSSWDWHDLIPEIRYAVSRTAKVGGYAELGVYKLGKDGQIEDQVTGGIAGEIGEMLYSPYGGQRGLIERFLTLMKVPADSYLIECDNGGEADGFDFVSSDEIKLGDGTSILDTTSGAKVYRITLPSKSRWGDDIMEERIAPASFYGRVWRPSSRFIDLPDSPLHPLDSVCEQLHLSSLTLRAKLLSRLASNGIIYVPSEINEARAVGPTGEVGEFSQNSTLNTLIQAAVYSARNPGDAEAALPVFISGPAAFSEALRHITMDQDLYETDMALRAELMGRILIGLDVQPAQVKGVEDSNHWSAWASSEDELRVAVKPDLDTMCWGMTRLVLWKKMQEAGLKPGHISRHVVYYDLSKAQSHINAAEDARQLADRLYISGETVRRTSGFEERDAPDDIEYIRQVGIKCSIPYLATYGMADAANFDWEKITPTKTGPDADSQGDKPKSGPGKGSPGSPSDIRSDTPRRIRPA